MSFHLPFCHSYSVPRVLHASFLPAQVFIVSCLSDPLCLHLSIDDTIAALIYQHILLQLYFLPTFFINYYNISEIMPSSTIPLEKDLALVRFTQSLPTQYDTECPICYMA